LWHLAQSTINPQQAQTPKSTPMLNLLVVVVLRDSAATTSKQKKVNHV
jgi:hypothetical protein